MSDEGKPSDTDTDAGLNLNRSDSTGLGERSLRAQAEANVIAVRGSSDVPGFEACVESELQRLSENFGNGIPPTVTAFLDGFARYATDHDLGAFKFENYDLHDKVGFSPFASGMIAAADMLDCTEQQIRLAAGEMTPQEMRTVKAVLAWRKAVIRRTAGLDG